MSLLKKSGLQRSVALPMLILIAAGSTAQAAEVNWFTLLTEDEESAARFYGNLLGWEFERGPGGGLIALHRGTPIGGISQIADTLPDVSEAIWLAAVSVPDVAASAAIAEERGGTLVTEVTRLQGLVTYAVVEDPQGAPMVLTAEETLIGGTQGAGAWLWAELWTTDPGAAMDFYADVAGFTKGTIERDGNAYNILSDGGTHQAGVTQMTTTEVSPRWAPYLGEQDLRATLVRIWELGGQVLLEPAEIDDEERTALVIDSTGGGFFLYELDEEQLAAGRLPVQSITAEGTPAKEFVLVPMPEERQKSRANVHMSFSYGYGYGPGWGPGYQPGYPYRPSPY